MLLENLILFLTALIFLVLSGGWLVKLIVRLAHYFRLSEFTIAFIIMAFATSIPELFVGINSALDNNTSLSFGNVIGANIANLTLVIGLSALISNGIKSKSKYMRRDLFLMFLFALSPLVLLLLGRDLSRIDGIILLILFFGYILFLVKNRRKSGKINSKDNRKTFLLLFLFISSIAILFISSHLVVVYAKNLAIDLLLPQIIIGLFLISFGTTLPELVFGIKAALQKKPELALGNSMGSVVTNSTLVLGLASVINPITNGISIFLISAVYLLLVIGIFSIMIFRQRGLGIFSALVLLLLYFLFIILGFGINVF